MPIVFIFIAILAFLLTALIILYLTFSKNADYILSILLQVKEGCVNKELFGLDKFTRWAFFIGIVFALISGIICATYKVDSKGKHMSKNEKIVSQKSITAMDSLRDLHALKPTVNTNKNDSPKNQGFPNLEELKAKASMPTPNNNSKLQDKKDN